MKGDPGRQHLIPAPGESSFPGLVGVRGWECRVVSTQVGHWCGKPGVGTVLSGVGRSRTTGPHAMCLGLLL